jgi:hypothetical protein
LDDALILEEVEGEEHSFGVSRAALIMNPS